MAKSKKAEMQIERRTAQDRREAEDRRKKPIAQATDRRHEDRRQVQRRRQIDPTTCERDYTDDEIEFMQALDSYKRTSGRMFPTCSEILEVIRSLGYVRVLPEEPSLEHAPGQSLLASSDSTTAVPAAEAAPISD